MEQLRVEGGQLLDAVKKLIDEGTVRRIVVKQGDRTIVEFPLTIGVVGAAVAPVLAAAGAIAALVTDCTIEVERQDAGSDENQDLGTTAVDSTTGTGGGELANSESEHPLP